MSSQVPDEAFEGPEDAEALEVLQEMQGASFARCGRPFVRGVVCLHRQSPHVCPRGGGPPRRSPQVVPTGDPHSRSEDALPERKLSLLFVSRLFVGCLFLLAPRGINKRNFPFE